MIIYLAPKLDFQRAKRKALSRKLTNLRSVKMMKMEKLATIEFYYVLPSERNHCQDGGRICNNSCWKYQRSKGINQ